MALELNASFSVKIESLNYCLIKGCNLPVRAGKGSWLVVPMTVAFPVSTLAELLPSMFSPATTTVAPPPMESLLTPVNVDSFSIATPTRV